MLIELSKRDRQFTESITKGVQMKWYCDKTYFKADTFGYEGLSEFLVSTLLQFSDIQVPFAKYSLCWISEGEKRYRGCCSSSFVQPNESLIPCGRYLYLKYREYYELFNGNSEEKIEKYINVLGDVQGAREGILSLFLVDVLTLNTDRHFNNIALIDDGANTRISPIFDKGDALLSDTTLYTLRNGRRVDIIEKNLWFKPFGIIHSSLVKVLQYYNVGITINYTEFLRYIDRCSLGFEAAGYFKTEVNRALHTLDWNLRKLEGVLCRLI